MKKIFTSTLIFILGCSTCQNTAPISMPTNTPDPTNTPKPTPVPPTPTLKIMAKNLIERADLRTGKGPVYSHNSIVACEYGIPAVMAARNATRHIQSGQMVTVDGKEGTVSLENQR